MKEFNPILCVQSRYLVDFPCVSSGFVRFDDRVDYRSLIELIGLHGEFIPRHRAEIDEVYKQVVVQAVLVAKGTSEVLLHTIPTTGGESRLHNKTSVLLGGHVEQEDGKDVLSAVLREFGEEVDYDYTCGVNPVGYIRMEDTPVNRVHFGLVFEFLGEQAIDPLSYDSGVMSPKFVDSKKFTEDDLSSMTSWSAAVAREYCVRL